MHIEKPDLSHMTTSELVQMMMACRMSYDDSDRQFAKFCRDEIATRKPSATNRPHDIGDRE